MKNLDQQIKEAKILQAMFFSILVIFFSIICSLFLVGNGLLYIPIYLIFLNNLVLFFGTFVYIVLILQMMIIENRLRLKKIEQKLKDKKIFGY